MTTSANVTEYRIWHGSESLCVMISQHAYCKDRVTDKLKEFVPPEDYTIQLSHDDEDEVTHYSKKVNLKDYLDGKYRHTMWRDDDGNLDDSHYCVEHGYTNLKENCVECLKARVKELEAKIVNMEKDASKFATRLELQSQARRDQERTQTNEKHCGEDRL